MPVSMTGVPLGSIFNQEKANKENERLQSLRRASIEDARALYLSRDITRKQYDEFRKAKAEDEVSLMLSQNGYLSSIYLNTVRHIQKGWDNYVEAWNARAEASKPSTEGKPKDSNLKQSMGDLYNTGLQLWGMVQMAGAILFGSGAAEVTGQAVKEWALSKGVTPGLANLLGLSAEVGPSFLPIGTLARSGVKTAQRVVGNKAEASKTLGEEVSKLAQEPAPYLPGRLSELYHDFLEAAPPAPGKPGYVTVGLDEATQKLDEVYRQVHQPQQGLKLTGSSDDVTDFFMAAKSPEERVVAQSMIDSLGTDGVQEVASLASKTPIVKLLETESFLSKAEKITKGLKKEDAVAELPKLAEKYGIDANNLLMPGASSRVKPMTERQLVGYLKAMEEEIPQLQQLAQRALTNDDEAVEFMRHVTNLFNPTPVLEGKPRISTTFSDFLIHWDPESVARGDMMGAIRTLANDLSALTPEKLAQFAIQNQQGFVRTGQVWPAIKQVYANLLLPFSWTSATVGNMMSTSAHFAETFAGAAFSADREAGRRIGEAAFGAKGMTLALGDMFKAANAKFWETGAKEAGRFDSHAFIPGLPSQVIRKPMDAVMAVDEFFKTGLMRASLYEDALRIGKQAGLAGDELADFIKTRVDNAWFIDPESWQRAEDLAKIGTFQNNLGRWGSHFQQLSQNSPLFFYFPFVKSFLDLTKYSWNRTPGLQLISKSLYNDIAEGGVKADDAIGRLTMSNFLGYYLYELAKDGYITGRGPVDPQLRATWMAAGNKPYSVKTPFGWLSLENMEPLTGPVKLIADYASMSDQLDDMSVKELGMAVTYTLFNSFVNNGAWHTVAYLGDAITGVSRGLWNQSTRDTLLNPFITFATGGTAPKRIADILDPVVKETRDLTDAFMARIPGFSAEVPPRRDASGKIMVPPKSLGSNWFGLFSPLIPKFKEEGDDPIAKLAEDLQVKYPEFEWNVGGRQSGTSLKELRPGDSLGVDLTPKERNEWIGRWRESYRSAIQEDLLNDEEFQNGPLAYRRVRMEAFLRGHKKMAWLQMLPDRPDLVKRWQDSIIQSNSPLLQPDERQGFADDIRSSTGIFDDLDEATLDNLLKFGDITQQEVN